MDFTLSPKIEETRAAFRAWLQSNLPDADRWKQLHDRGPVRERIEFLKEWQHRLYDGRWVAVHFPSEYGGRDASLLEHLAVHEEMVRVAAPPLINGPSISIFGPTLLVFGRPDQKQRYLPKLLSAEEVWCLGFSEPNAGSDLASLRTRAARDGDDWVLNGQKVWTTYANQADYCMFLVRTDPDAPQHKGISCLIVPLRTPGVTVRPLREMTGDTDFNEVFLDNARVPADSVVGEVNKGWQVILTALGHERGTLLLVDHMRRQEDMARLLKLIRWRGKTSDRTLRQQFAQFQIEVEIMKLHCFKVMSDLEQGRPQSDVSILKLYGSELVQRLDDFGLSVQGPYAQLWRGTSRVPDEGQWQYGWLMARAMTIASGTSEVQRNIIAQRLLGLPRG
ncbi:MAG TPA: acyl-CoA dehydrogenase family protein [Candidatus Margulisiibacteriota bacterium]|nr:acyl-CoA dehydrogenase family protein [Candidatus Margulisiibacteriota bacterium]